MMQGPGVRRCIIHTYRRLRTSFMRTVGGQRDIEGAVGVGDKKSKTAGEK
jgi:hypothetical protein